MASLRDGSLPKRVERRVSPRMIAATQAVIVLVPGTRDPRGEIGGLSLLERLFRQLSELGSVREIVVVAPPDVALPEPSERVATPVIILRATGNDRWKMLRAVDGRLQDRFVFVAGDLLVDERILGWLVKQTFDVLFRRDADSLPEFLGSMARSSLVDSASLPASAALVSVYDFPTYWQDRRGHVPVHCLRVARSADVEEAWKLLLDHVEKRALDLPARYFDPPFEAFLVRRLCPTRVTPNQVTLATGVFGFAVTALFGFGWLRLGVLLAIFVEVLDGVDGKLARIKHMTSRAGELEHVLDFFYENSWYVALGLFLSTNGAAWALPAAASMVAFDLIDNLVNMAFGRFRGRNLAEASTFLSRFRLVSGRRNIYTWIFLPGFLAGQPAFSFAAAAAWAGMTASVHTVAALLESWRRSPQEWVAKLRIRDLPTRASPAASRRGLENIPRGARAAGAGRDADASVPQRR
jgi:phosphatidylglycerophosphate synthase